MRFFRILSRVAFICNFCFLLAALVQYIPHVPDSEILSTIIVLGYIVSVLINVLLNLSLVILFLFGVLKKAQIPQWLVVVNFIFFIIQSILIITSFPV